MTQLPTRPRHLRPRWWAITLTAALLTTAALVALKVIPPEYQVSLNGRFVARTRSIPVLQAALSAEAARQTEREVTLEAEHGRWLLKLTDLGISLPPDAALNQLNQATTELPWWQRLALSRPHIDVLLDPTWDTAQLQQALIPIRSRVDRPPTPAKLTIENREPVITPETPGATLDAQALMETLNKEQTTIAIPITQTLPDVTAASLASLRIKRLIAEWSTSYDPSIPRGENVAKAALAFDGLMIQPNQVLSYNDTVGPINTGTGWREAPVIENGQLVPGVGGGVCQVATTFYGAALRANLDIVERHQHQLAVAYIPPSQDAAIAQGWEDLRLRNNTQGHLLVQTESGGGTVTFRIYGDLPTDQQVKIESKVTGSHGFPSKTITDPSLAPGQEIVKTHGIQGLSSEAFRLVYRGGELVKRELLSRDDYLPTTQVLVVGPVVQPPAPPVTDNNH